MNELSKLLDSLNNHVEEHTRYKAAYERIGFDVTLPDNSLLSKRMDTLTTLINRTKKRIIVLFDEK